MVSATECAASDNTAGAVSVLLGNGNGAFQAAQTFAIGANPISVAAGDVNGDGKVDLVAANLNSDSVSILVRALRQQHRLDVLSA